MHNNIKQFKKFSDIQYALADGFTDSNCEYFLNVPGAKSQELFEILGGKKISINERIAFEASYGASLAGKRTVISMKNVGLNACLDPFLHAVLNGVHGGLVLVLYDDVEVTSSPERQDSRSLNEVFPCIWLEPNSIQLAYDMAFEAPFLSEYASMPIVIRITNQMHRLKETYKRKKSEKVNLGIANKRDTFISYWTKRTKLYEKQLILAKKLAEKKFNKKPNSIHEFGVIMAGCCWEELNNSGYKDFDILEINTYPINENLVSDFLKKHSKIVVFEQGFPYVRNQIHRIIGKNSFVLESKTGNIPDLKTDWISWNLTEKLFKGLKKVNPSYVVGDEGQFTDETTKTIQSCLCMGASVGVTIGLAANRVEYPYAVTGDTSFLHGGMQSLEEAIIQETSFGIIVIDNGGAKSTGGQKRYGSIDIVPKGIKQIYLKYEETSIEDFYQIFKNMRNEKKLAIVYVTLGDNL